MNVQTIDIDSVVPYWRNPRQVTDAAVASVMESIERYGYQAPIIVDSSLVVIAGHTRLQALRRLGYEQIDVIVSDMSDTQAKEYRLVDNRTSEYGEWDRNKMFLELREFADAETAARFFPEVNLNIDVNSVSLIVDHEDMERAVGRLADLTAPAAPRETKMILCPHCLEEFEISGK